MTTWRRDSPRPSSSSACTCTHTHICEGMFTVFPSLWSFNYRLQFLSSVYYYYYLRVLFAALLVFTDLSTSLSVDILLLPLLLFIMSLLPFSLSLSLCLLSHFSLGPNLTVSFFLLVLLSVLSGPLYTHFCVLWYPHFYLSKKVQPARENVSQEIDQWPCRANKRVIALQTAGYFFFYK